MSDPRGRMDDYSWGKTLYRYRSGPAGDATRQYAAIADAAGVADRARAPVVPRARA